MGLVDLTKDLTYNSNFETESVENQQQQVSSDFQTSNLESSPTEEIGSVNFFQNPHGADENGVGGFNISGFTQFMPKLETLYPGEGLNNSGIVDFFPNPHSYSEDNFFVIPGFTANMQKYETLYPSKNTLELSGINSGIVDFLPNPHGIGHFGGNDVPHDIEGFVADVQPLSDGFYPNTIQLGSVDFIPGGPFSNNFVSAVGFTARMLDTQYLMTFGVNESGEPLMELAGYIETEINNLPSMQLGTYKGAVDFISDSDSYATGFTKNMYVDGE